MSIPLEFIYLGKTGFRESLSIMDEKIAESVQQKKGFLLGLEYDIVYTRGMNFRMTHLQNPALETIFVRRGGSVTLHNNGQLVVYTIVPFSFIRNDITLYIRFLERVIIKFLGQWDIPAFTRKNRTGVFTRQGKIAFIGLSVKKNTVYYGLAINVSNDLGDYAAIKSCGLSIPNTNIREVAMKPGGAINTETVFNGFSILLADGLEKEYGISVKPPIF